MCTTVYQTYAKGDCFLVKITYCPLSARLIGNTCPKRKERVMQFPFRCGNAECPRLETSLRFESLGRTDRKQSE
jgi:hypothetical protein